MTDLRDLDQPGEELMPVRVRVTGPATTRHRVRSVSAEIDDRTELGEVYVRSLMRSQLRLALGVSAVLALTVGLLPLLFEAVPAIGRTGLLGVPLPWLILGLGVYPFLLLLAWVYLRRAERNESAFRDLVSPPPHGPPDPRTDRPGRPDRP